METRSLRKKTLFILVNNAGAMFLAGTADTPMKRFDLMHAVNFLDE